MSATEALVAALGRDRVIAHAPLAPLTTFRVGGPADWLVEVHSASELQRVIEIARAESLPLTMLGGGSNVLVSDAGVRGLVVRFRGGTIDLHGGEPPSPSGATVLVRADGGVTMNGLVRWTINRGLAGLEAWAGTPGTVGGAIHGNAHFGGCLIGDLVESVRLAAPDGRVLDVPAGEMGFGYDVSRLQHTREILLWAVFRTKPGAVASLRDTARQSLAFRKRTQPLDTPSAGCIFQNPQGDEATRLPEDVPPSAGALVDRAGLKGCAAGGARVSATHGNFIVNEGGATAADIVALVRKCQEAVARRFGVRLREEIVYLGEFPADVAR
jgi:UDP-N-acetylmuramate dehydrogenase